MQTPYTVGVQLFL